MFHKHFFWGGEGQGEVKGVHDSLSSFKNTVLIQVLVLWSYLYIWEGISTMASRINSSPAPMLFSFCSVIWSFPKLFSSELHFAAIYEEFCIATLVSGIQDSYIFFIMELQLIETGVWWSDLSFILYASCEIIVAKCGRKQNKKHVTKVRTLSPGNPQISAIERRLGIDVYSGKWSLFYIFLYCQQRKVKHKTFILRYKVGKESNIVRNLLFALLQITCSEK